MCRRMLLPMVLEVSRNLRYLYLRLQRFVSEFGIRLTHPTPKSVFEKLVEGDFFWDRSIRGQVDKGNSPRKKPLVLPPASAAALATSPSPCPSLPLLFRLFKHLLKGMGFLIGKLFVVFYLWLIGEYRSVTNNQ